MSGPYIEITGLDRFASDTHIFKRDLSCFGVKPWDYRISLFCCCCCCASTFVFCLFQKGKGNRQREGLQNLFSTGERERRRGNKQNAMCAINWNLFRKLNSALIKSWDSNFSEQEAQSTNMQAQDSTLNEWSTWNWSPRGLDNCD